MKTIQDIIMTEFKDINFELTVENFVKLKYPNAAVITQDSQSAFHIREIFELIHKKPYEPSNYEYRDANQEIQHKPYLLFVYSVGDENSNWWYVTCEEEAWENEAKKILKEMIDGKGR